MKPVSKLGPSDGLLPRLVADRARSHGEPATPRATSDLLDLIGGTPCVELRAFGGGAPRAGLLAKVESGNPGGSIKDRTAWAMLRDARANGRLRPGQAVVEPTAGNTGIGLALVGGALGHPVVVVMPARYGPGKRELCRLLGARVVDVPGDEAGMRECREAAERLAEREGGVVLDQFSNASNPDVHERATGPEIWRQCGGEVDAVVLGVGTGGTFTGVVRALKRHRPDLLAVGVENEASVLSGKPRGESRIEGIGNSFFPATFDVGLVDDMIRVRDEDAFEAVRELARTEGLLAGGSGGAACWAALQVARRLGPGRRVVTLIADGAQRYCGPGDPGSAGTRSPAT